MDRLTRHDGDKPCCILAARMEDNRYCEELYTRLAAYEDTGLTPEEIQEAVDLFPGSDDLPKEIKSWVERCTWHCRKCAELRAKLDKYEKAEADGRLIALPCKVGDTVWAIRKRGIVAGAVSNFNLTKGQISIGYDFDETIFDHGMGFFGENVFLTREAAEAALGKEEQS